MQVKNIPEIEAFLEDVRTLLKESKINVIPTKKNKEFRSRHSIVVDDIISTLKCLTYHEYAKTDADKNASYAEDCWFFGCDFQVDSGVERVYVKLKLRSDLIVLSFHDFKYGEFKYPYPR